MPAGSIVVELLAKTGSFDTDINRSTKAAEKRVKEMEATFKQAGAAIGSAFAGIGLIAFSKNLISGLDALNDLADATGASIENLSALEDIAARTGTSFETVGNAVVKFNQQLKGTDPDSKAARALEMLGLSMEDLQKMDPAEALHKTALALAGFADDGNKARLVQELFGKSTKEVAAFLKDLADQAKLVGTVTTEDAKQAEAFNQQLAQMAKNSKDLARSIAGDLLPELNALLKAWREGGTLGALFGVGGMDDPGKKLVEINDKLTTLRKNVADFPKAHPWAQWWSAEDLPIMNAQIAALEKEQKFLKSLQQTRALNTMGSDVSDAMSRRLGRLPTLGTLTEKAKKDPKAAREKEPPKFPDDDFDNIMKQLEGQIEKIQELSAEERILQGLREGTIKISTDPMLRDSEEQELLRKARMVDLEKERRALMNLGRERSIAAGDEINKRNEDEAARVQSILGGTTSQKMKQQEQDLEALSRAWNAGVIKDAKTYNEALDIVLGRTDQLKEFSEGLGEIGSRALQDLVTGGQSLNDVLKNVLHSLANMILQIGVIEPMMKKLREAMKGSGDGGGGFDLGRLLLGSLGSALSPGVAMSLGDAAGMSIGGTYGPQTQAGLDDLINSISARASGGPVSANEPYMVGERGREMFVPRTAGMIVPNSALRSSGGEAPVIVNQTTGRVDNVQRQPMPDGREAWILQELTNPNSKVSRTLQHRYNLRPAR